jgi:hypothetical protein
MLHLWFFKKRASKKPGKSVRKWLCRRLLNERRFLFSFFLFEMVAKRATLGSSLSFMKKNDDI